MPNMLGSACEPIETEDDERGGGGVALETLLNNATPLLRLRPLLL